MKRHQIRLSGVNASRLQVMQLGGGREAQESGVKMVKRASITVMRIAVVVVTLVRQPLPSFLPLIVLMHASSNRPLIPSLLHSVPPAELSFDSPNDHQLLSLFTNARERSCVCVCVCGAEEGARVTSHSDPMQVTTGKQGERLHPVSRISHILCPAVCRSVSDHRCGGAYFPRLFSSSSYHAHCSRIRSNVYLCL